MPKAIVYLGSLQIIYDIPDSPDDYQILTEKTWKVNRLNLAATMEGWNPRDCLPFKEQGADGNKYVGFVHMPSGQKLRFGQQKAGAGGDWFVRSKSRDSYKGPEPYLKPEDFAGQQLYQGETPQQLPPAQSSAAQQPRPPQEQTSLDDGAPANDNQKRALANLTARVLGFDDFGYSDQKTLFENLGFNGVNMLSESEAARLIVQLQKRLKQK